MGSVTMALNTVILSLSIIGNSGPCLACWSREKSCCLNVSSPSGNLSSPSGNMSSFLGNNSSAMEDLGRLHTRFAKQWIGQKKAKEEKRKMTRQEIGGSHEESATENIFRKRFHRHDEKVSRDNNDTRSS